MGVGRVALKIADYKNGGVFWSEPVGHLYVNVGISDLMTKLTLHTLITYPPVITILSIVYAPPSSSDAVSIHC